MDNRYQITAEMMRDAKNYIPIGTKEAFASVASVGCVQPSADFDAEGGLIPMEQRDKAEQIAPVYCENTHYKSRVFLGAVLLFYFGIGKDRETLTLTPDEYDGWSGAHVMSQIERFKSDPAWKNKAFEILADIRDLEKRLNNAVYALLKNRNDPVKRMARVAATMFSAEFVENALKEAKAAEEGIAEERRKQQEFIDGLTRVEEEKKSDG